ncbi:MAG: carbamoyltransferase C-terminal domain-containing protein [Bacteroidota bacterium]
MYILGINAHHGDSSACILKDGQIIAATEEERFTRVKHWAGMPIQSIAFCVREAGIDFAQIDHICIGRDPRAKLAAKIKYQLSSVKSIIASMTRFKNLLEVSTIKDQLASGLNIDKDTIKAEVHNIEHHRSHLASAFFASPFEEAAILSVDGSGDFTTAMTAIGRGNKIEVLDSVDFPVSIGRFYTAFTQYLGFPYFGDEYKVMGLSPYGSPKYVEQIRKMIYPTDDGLFNWDASYFLGPREGYYMKIENHIPQPARMFSDKIAKVLGPARQKSDPLEQKHKDIAASVQAVTEEIIMSVLTHLHKRTKLDNICIAGGVAQNSVANGKVTSQTPFKNLYVPNAGHDAGISMGAALYLYHHDLEKPRSKPFYNPYTGSKFEEKAIVEALENRNLNFKRYEDDDLFQVVSERIINEGVIGWYQERAEFGPRALGNRSILADPRNDRAKELLNLKIKKRESFRPFAPSILKEHVPEYFDKVEPSPFMERVLPIKREKHEVIPAVTHVNGSGRLQTVEFDINPKYYNLIKEFYKKTGVPILLNTSFNENEPIVNSPAEAIDCFLRTKMDMLVLDNYVIER